MPKHVWARSPCAPSVITAGSLLCLPLVLVCLSVCLSSCFTALSPSLPPARIREEAHRSSSEEDDTDVDVEGLRRRRGREPGTPQPAATLGVECQGQGEGAGGELGISLNMCLLGSLVLLGLGVLLFGERSLPRWHLEPLLGPLLQHSDPILPLPVSPFQVASQSLTVVSEGGP